MSTPIAICGMALRLPGGISTPLEFWDFLLAKRNARGRVPESRYAVSSYYSSSGGNGTIKTQHGYFLDEAVDLGALDTSFFSFTKLELELVDPQQRLLLEVVRECFESAGEVEYRGKDIGCFVGSFGDDWVQTLFHDPQMYAKYPLMTGGDYAIPNRISYEYDLRGPSMSIRTACSSTMVCLHEACVAMQRGDCSAAIVAGCNLIMTPTMTAIMTAKGVLSPDGTSKTFDAAANGYGRGEAINAIYIKPLPDALRDGNPIRAVIRGTATNFDGKSSGVNVPSQIALEKVIHKAYMSAGIDDVSETPFVECHGTGTAVGDPIEVNAIANVFGDRGTYIGSAKPNVGHSEGASGLTSLIKTVLALENEVIPPNIHFNTPNPRIPFEEKNIIVPVDATAWPQDRCIRVSINSFGMGGVNAHAILESARTFTRSCSASSVESPKSASLLLHSANSLDSLQRLVEEHQKYLRDRPSALADMAYTLGSRREHLPFRAASIIQATDLSLKTTEMRKIPPCPPKLIFIFTGQGAQWPGMGVPLYKSNPIFKQSILRLEEILHALPDAPLWSIADEMMKPVETSNLRKAKYAQPICVAIQIALVDVLSKLNIIPLAVIGHSSGELAAAYAAGKLTAREAFISAFYRGIVSEDVPNKGKMAAIGMGRKEVNEFLTPGVVIACENSPSSVTISGNPDALNEVMYAIRDARSEVPARELKVDVAYHSPHMKDVGERYRSLMQPFLAKSSIGDVSTVEFFSSVTGTRLEEGTILGPEYWQSNLESPVLFYMAIQSLASQNTHPILFLEIGPHSTLSGPIRQTLDQVSLAHSYVSCLVREKDCNESFLSALGELYLHNIPVDPEPLLNPDGQASVRTDLPTYPWKHTYSSLFRPRKNTDWLFMKYPKHELLGIRVSESTDNEPCFRNVLPLEDVPWLQDHKVAGDVIFPAAGFLCMAGEAVRQLNPQRSAGFHVRDMVLGTALLLNDLKSIELLTTLRRVRSLDWYDFSISSHNGIHWVEHCSGQICGMTQHPTIVPGEKGELPRRIDPQTWYKALEQVGYKYGPAFHGMRNTFSSTNSHIAAGNIISSVDESTYYTVHPTSLDTFFQIVYMAVQNGRVWGLDRLLVPTQFADIEIYTSSSSDLTARTWGGSFPNGGAWGSGYVLGSDGAVVVKLSQASMSPIGGEESGRDRSDTGHTVRLCWKPDIQFLSLANLVTSPSNWEEHTKLLNKLTMLCIAEARSRLEGVQSTIPHLQKYHSWLQKQHSVSVNDNINSVVEHILASRAAPCANAMLKVLDNIVAIFKGEIEPLELLMSNDTLFNLYNYLNESDRGALFRLLGHRHPKQRILEIGAGTGGSTVRILPETRYSTYTFTDVSAAFFPPAKERLKEYPNLIFKTLDITSNPLDQGFEPESFDLIVAANVLHATPSLHQTLMNVRRLLHPQGKLLLEELCPETKFPNFITGVLPGWWAGEADDRVDEPYVHPERWECELKKAGFGGLDSMTFDTAPPFHKNAFMLASPGLGQVYQQKRVVLISDSTSTETTILLQRELRLRGYDVTIQGLQDRFADGQDVIAVVDTISPFFHGIDVTKMSNFQLFLRHLQQSNSRCLWITRASQVHCQDPRFSLAIGVARTVRSEFAIDFVTCELDTIGHTSISLAIEVFEKVNNRGVADHTLSEQEYVISRNVVHIGRIFTFSISKELTRLGKAELENNDPTLSLTVGSYGALDSISWTANLRCAMRDDELEVEVDSAGVNFKDVLMTLGIVEAADPKLGLEAAGVVRRVGSNVHNLSPGDRVFIIGPGGFSTVIVAKETQCAKIPDSLPLEDAATMPLVFATVIHSLLDIGKLDKSQTVLIHGASGGVGIAAIQICQMVGVTIYATVGSNEKAEYLAQTYLIPQDHIFSSRDSLFLSGVINATHGHGVDIVLNSFSGELFQASCACVAECGRLIDLAKGNRLLSLKYLRSNASYEAIDMTDYLRLKPDECKRILETIVDLYTKNKISPIRPVRTFGADEISDCFKYMQQGQHIGKLRISLNNKDNSMAPSFPAKTITFRRDAAYLLVGGLGGLGAALARWIAERYATNLIFLSRHAGDSPSDKALFDELKRQGCSLSIIKGSVRNASDVEAAISSASKPLRGIFNLSMVLKDQSLLRMSLDEWDTAIGPKVHGTWNLHKACVSHELDFFMLFSSMCGILGMPGQANYAAANTFLDSFVQYRHQMGLPASVVDLGAVEGIGYIADNPNVLERSKWLKHVLMSQKELFRTVTAAISQSLPIPDTNETGYTNAAQIATGFRNRDTTKATDPFTGNAFFFDARLTSYLQDTTDDSSPDSSAGQNQLSNFITAAAADPTVLSEPAAQDFVAKQIAQYVFDLLMKPVEDIAEIDLSRSLSDVGLDSLAAVEVRSWWKSTFGIDISVLEITSMISFEALGERALQGLKAKFVLKK